MPFVGTSPSPPHSPQCGADLIHTQSCASILARVSRTLLKILTSSIFNFFFFPCEDRNSGIFISPGV